MKSKVFIGSSAEGLKIAYAIQQNIRHVAETTVWDQGVFELSSTSIESLIEVLDSSDFGIFVFSPDDVVKMRGEENQVVRDNVLFELGLFIGRLGRKRSFIVVPEETDIKLPTDLLGITPGKYEVGRSDNSDQAATGPSSHQITLSIEKYGPRNIEEAAPTIESTVKQDSEKSKENIWIKHYFDKNYEESLNELEKLIKKEKEKDHKLNLELWKADINWLINPATGDSLFRDCIKKNKSNSIPYLRYINTLMYNDLYDEGIKLIDEGISNTSNAKDEFICKRVEYLIRIGEEDNAKTKLIKEIDENKSVKLFLKLVEISNEIKDSHRIIHEAYLNYPTDEQIISKYSSIAVNLELPKISLFLLEKLIKIDGKNSAYWTMLGNTYLSLNLNGRAMASYEKGNDIAKGKESWILGNIGNLFNNVGLHSKAIDSLELALEKDPKSEYAHNRLSSAIIKKEEEDKKVTDFLKEGRIAIRNTKFDSDLDS